MVTAIGCSIESDASAIMLSFNSWIFFGSSRASRRKILPLTILIALKTATVNDQYYVHNGYETVAAHFKREPRFYAAIAFDGGVWYGNGELNNPTNAFYVQAKGTTSYAGPKDQSHTNITGYWAKKLVNYLTVYGTQMTYENFHFPLMRLSDLYLMYAEALNEQGKNFTEVLPYIDIVRARANIPAIRDSYTASLSTNPSKYTTQSGLRQIIHQERRIELAFECVPGWDLRRWKELQKGMKISGGVMQKIIGRAIIGVKRMINFLVLRHSPLAVNTPRTIGLFFTKIRKWKRLLLQPLHTLMMAMPKTPGIFFTAESKSRAAAPTRSN